MTLRLYYDSDTLEFDATIVAHDGDQRRVILDRTAFYPTSGGQPHDTGTLNGVSVVDVIDRDEHIVHLLDAPLPPGSVRGSIDPDRRQDYTVQHSAQHLISAIAADTLGWHTASVHFGSDHSTIEFDTAAASDAQLEALELACNDAIGAALPVTISYADAASATGLRKPAGRTGTIRIVTIEGLDRSACGGTHLNNTARLGCVFLADIERIRGRIRVGYLAGARVHSALRSRNTLIFGLSQATAVASDELLEVIPRRLEQGRRNEKLIQELREEIAGHRIATLLAAEPEQNGGLHRLVLDSDFGPPDLLQLATAAATRHPRTICIAFDDNTRTILLGASPDSGIDAAATLRSALADFGGRGGGSTTLARGSVPDQAAVRLVIAALETR